MKQIFCWPTEGEKKETIAAFMPFYSRLVRIICNEVPNCKWTWSDTYYIDKSEDKTDEKHILLLGDFHF